MEKLPRTVLMTPRFSAAAKYVAPKNLSACSFAKIMVFNYVFFHQQRNQQKQMKRRICAICLDNEKYPSNSVIAIFLHMELHRLAPNSFIAVEFCKYGKFLLHLT